VEARILRIRRSLMVRRVEVGRQVSSVTDHAQGVAYPDLPARGVMEAFGT